LVVRDRAEAISFLAHVNYYRLSGYCLAFETERHCFISGTTFDSIRSAYEFDAELRDALAEGLEVVEIDVRTAIAHHFGQRYGAFGHIDARHFHAPFHHPNWRQKLQQEARRSNERFVRHFRAQYREFPDLPVWMVTEIASFGAISMMFKNMLKVDQRAIGSRYGVQAHYFESWMHHLVYARNVCAHHGRVWDREWAIKPKLPDGHEWRTPFKPANDRVVVSLLILSHLLDRVPSAEPFRAAWVRRIEQILTRLPDCPDARLRMGMPADWRDHRRWS